MEQTSMKEPYAKEYFAMTGSLPDIEKASGFVDLENWLSRYHPDFLASDAPILSLGDGLWSPEFAPLWTEYCADVQAERITGNLFLQEVAR